jgi:deferrochelatase/peroxidase EfeB
MSAVPVAPDKAQVQRLVAIGYDLHCCRHFVLRVQDAARARDFIADILKRGLITDASVDKNGLSQMLEADPLYCPASIGFTYRGLEALGLMRPYLRVFQEKARAFTEGAYCRAARRLADTALSAAQFWETCFKPEQAHVLITLHADDDGRIDAVVKSLSPEQSGLAGWDQPHRGRHLIDNRSAREAHFGVRDGIANPAIRGIHDQPANPSGGEVRKKVGRDLCAAGEFLLGYANDADFNPWLLINPLPAPNPWLRPLAPIDPDFFRDASFGAFRKIEQDEAAFKDFLEASAATLDVSADYVKAKLVGRWDDGSLVQPGAKSPSGENKNADLNDFDFSADPKGEGCPFGAHIRRMNPRNDPVVPFRKRPLMRRGIPYGKRYVEAPGDKRGLLGLFFCASLEDQFEHLLSSWANENPMGPRNRGTAKDPLIGHHEDPGAVFDVPTPPDATLCRIKGFTPFVTTRGTMYAFYPGIRALGMIPGLCTAV